MDTIQEKVQTEIDQEKQHAFYLDNREDIESYIEFACREGVLEGTEASEWTEDQKVAYWERGQAADLYSEPF